MLTQFGYFCFVGTEIDKSSLTHLIFSSKDTYCATFWSQPLGMQSTTFVCNAHLANFSTNLQREYKEKYGYAQVGLHWEFLVHLLCYATSVNLRNYRIPSTFSETKKDSWTKSIDRNSTRAQRTMSTVSSERIQKHNQKYLNIFHPAKIDVSFYTNYVNMAFIVTWNSQ